MKRLDAWEGRMREAAARLRLECALWGHDFTLLWEPGTWACVRCGERLVVVKKPQSVGHTTAQCSACGAPAVTFEPDPYEVEVYPERAPHPPEYWCQRCLDFRYDET